MSLPGTNFVLAGTIKTPKWINPVSGDLIITSGYSKRVNPVTNKEEFHNGLDISVPEDTEVRAVQDAVVTKAGRSEFNGVYMTLQTSDGYEIMYAHLNKVTVKEGAKVNKGDVVAYSGNTGRSTGPHLHYTLRLNGELINPIYYVNIKEV